MPRGRLGTRPQRYPRCAWPAQAITPFHPLVAYPRACPLRQGRYACNEMFALLIGVG